MKKPKIRFFSFFDVLLVIMVVIMGYYVFFPKETSILNIEDDFLSNYPVLLSGDSPIDSLYYMSFYSVDEVLINTEVDGNASRIKSGWVDFIRDTDIEDSEYKYVKLSDSSYKELYEKLGGYNIKMYLPAGSWSDHEFIEDELEVLSLKFNLGEGLEEDDIYISIYENYIDIDSVLYEFVGDKFDMDWLKFFVEENLFEVNLDV